MGARTHYFKSARRAPITLGGHEHSPFKGAQALIVQRQISNEQVSNCKVDMKEISSWNALLKKWVRAHPLFLGARRAPIILGGLDEHRFLRGREHSSFREHSTRELMNEHIWIWKESQKNKFMKYSLEKWGRAPIILWGHAHPLFWGLDEHPLF